MVLDDIKINDRQREEMGNDEYPIHKLASSIRATGGPVHKIVVDGEMNLIAGERRLTALKLLRDVDKTKPNDECPIDWDVAENFIDQRGEISEEKRFEMELEENLHRKTLTPREYNEALLKFHKIQSANNPANMKGPADPAKPRWTAEDTGNVVGLKKTQVSEDIRIAEVMSLLTEEKRAEIYKKAGQNKDMVKREINQMVNRGAKKVAAEERVEVENKLISADPTIVTKRNEVEHVEALAGLQAMETDSVDLIITDPPYGTLEGSAGEKGLGYAIYADRNFDDNEDRVYALLEDTIPEMYRVLRPGSHIYLFCGLAWNRKTNFYSIADIMDRAGFTVRGIPLIWSKPVQGYKPPFTHWPLNHEAIIFASTGKREREGAVPRSDVLEVKPIFGTQKEHRFQKPLFLIDHMLNVSMEPDGRFLDPFAGSGSHILAARKRWMKVQGFDADIEAVHTSRDRLSEWDISVLETCGVGAVDRIKRVKLW